MRVAQKLWITILSLLSMLLLVSLLTQYRNDRAMSEAMASIERIEQSITLTTRWQGLTEVVIERTMAYIHVVDPAASSLLGERTKANSAQISDIQQKVGETLSSCRIPDDCIDPKRYPLFMGREVVQELLQQLKTPSEAAT